MHRPRVEQPLLPQLAKRLSGIGFHVLRFDYYGTGDSAGDADEGDLRQWHDDLSAAVDELKDTAAIQMVSLIGLPNEPSGCCLRSAMMAYIDTLAAVWRSTDNLKVLQHISPACWKGAAI